MYKIAFKKHKIRGAEIIELLEMLGGKNIYNFTGNDDCAYYVIEHSEIRIGEYMFGNEPYRFFTLEEFEEKFPYKVGDTVLYKPDNTPYFIIKMFWKNDKVLYELSDKINLEVCRMSYTLIPDVDVVKLQPYKEEIMEEINIDRIGFNGNKAKLILPDGYEFKTEGKDAYIIKKKPQYPKTYEECCEAIGINRYDIEIDLPQTYQQKMFNLFKLLICRDAYWKIAGEQMGLGKPWKPDWNNGYVEKYYIYLKQNEIEKSSRFFEHHFLAFPTKEMRDAFYENFKELIENCKELL